MKPVNWIQNNLVFPPVISSPLVAGHKLKQHIIPFQKQVIKEALENNQNIFLGYSRQISKSSLYSWIALYLMDTKPCQGVTMGPTFGQADVIFRAIKLQILNNPELKKKYKLKAEVIENKENGSLIKKVYNSPSANLGQMALSFIIFDELCSYDEKAKQNMLTLLAGLAMSGLKPLLLFSTNPPIDPEHWSIDFIKKLKLDKTTKFFEFSANPKLNIYKKETWAEANPFIAYYLKTKDKVYKGTYDFYRAQAQGAKQSKTLELDYRRQQLGQFVNTDAFKFCESDRIKTTSEKVFKDKSLRWSLGIDPAWTKNFCAFALTGFNDDTQSVFIKPFLFLANTDIRREGQKLQFNEWHKARYIKIYNQQSIPRLETIHTVTDFIRDKKIHLEKVIVDPGMAKAWDFDKNFKNIEEVYNSPRNMTGPIRFLEKVIADYKCFLIGDNPAVLNQFNSAIVSVKSQDYCSIDKPSEWASVDIVVATTLAMKHLSETKKKHFNSFFITNTQKGGV